jgi:hypothetical protein
MCSCFFHDNFFTIRIGHKNFKRRIFHIILSHLFLLFCLLSLRPSIEHGHVLIGGDQCLPALAATAAGTLSGNIRGVTCLAGCVDPHFAGIVAQLHGAVLAVLNESGKHLIQFSRNGGNNKPNPKYKNYGETKCRIKIKALTIAAATPLWDEKENNATKAMDTSSKVVKLVKAIFANSNVFIDVEGMKCLHTIGWGL